MDIHLWQIAALTFLGYFGVYDSLNTKLGSFEPVVAGFITGIIMGDVKIGLTVGGTLQLMMMGVHNYGGSTIPDYMCACIISTAFTIANNQGLEFAVALAIPIGMLLMQLDVLARFANTFILHRAEKYCDSYEFRKVELCNLSGIIAWGISRALPIFLALYFGSDLVKGILDVAPEWVMNGFKIAGGIMPALGIAILLRFLPISNYYGYIIIGFVLGSYLQMPVLGAALVGLAFALIQYKQIGKDDGLIMQTETVNAEGIFDEDE